jgi:hypothetical protein
VIIPDAVFFEATRDATRLGASIIVEWVNANLGSVHIAPTNAFAAFTRDYEAGNFERVLDLGEQAAIEYARHHVHLEHNERAVLLSEDRKVTGLRLARDEAERTIIITMRDFLLTLERIGRINSADAVYNAVVRQVARLHNQNCSTSTIRHCEMLLRRCSADRSPIATVHRLPSEAGPQQ